MLFNEYRMVAEVGEHGRHFHNVNEPNLSLQKKYPYLPPGTEFFTATQT
jgi:hypothetical protein